MKNHHSVKKFDLEDDMQLERIAGNIKRANQRTAYTGWGAYLGLALNDDWKSIQNREKEVYAKDLLNLSRQIYISVLL